MRFLRKGNTMKIKELANLMNDYGTKPRIRIMKHEKEATLLIYEGRPDNIDKAVGQLKVNSFTVLGAGFLEVHA